MLVGLERNIAMPSALPEGYAARHLTHDDVETVAALLNLASMADLGLPLVSVDHVRDFFQLPFFEPLTDSWLVTTADGEPVGAGEAIAMEPYTEVQSLAVVHPLHEGRGIGTWLLERTEQ